jgi:hypothetical protein
MSSWRDEILRHFHRDGVRLTAIHDPDRLLTEEGILKAIQRNGYEVVAQSGEPVPQWPACLS